MEKEKESLLKRLEELKSCPDYKSNYEITIKRGFEFIKNSGKYDLYTTNECGKKFLWIRLYNNKGEYFNDKMWKDYQNDAEILDLCYCIINQIKGKEN